MEVSLTEQTRAKLAWQSGMRFSAEPGSGHGLTVDSVARAGHAGPGPMELMLISIAGCTAMDVVSILERMRQPLSGLDVEIVGDRAEQHPKRFTGIAMVYRARGHGLAREKVERAVELSQSTFCSAVASLREDCKITTSIEITEA